MLKGLSPQGTVPEWYYHYDGLGSVTNLTDSTGAVLESYTYDAFGKPNTTSTLGNRFMFTGREYDSETGLYYYRARYYSPTLGRFMQRDPVGYIAGINLYTYCSNNPINWIDPFGLDKQKNNPWWKEATVKVKEFFGIEPPEEALYLNLFLHFSVTVIQGGKAGTYGFGPDPRRMFPWQTPSGGKMYIWPFRSPGIVAENPRIGIPILITKDPQRVARITEGINATQEQSPGTNYSIVGMECIIWAIGASYGRFPEGQRKQ